MEQIKCPGQDTRYWKAQDIFTVECPKCGAEIEFFKDDTRRRCSWCGHLFYNPRIELGCAEYCQYADKCVPELVAQRQAMANFKDRLLAKVKELRGEEASVPLEEALGYAVDLLKAEGGDPKVVFAAVLLSGLSSGQAREVLLELDTEPEIVAEVLELLGGAAPPDDINCQVYQDVLALLEPTPAPSLQTRTGQKLAAARRS